MLPPAKPRATRELVRAIAVAEWRHRGTAGTLPGFFLLAVRGYYASSMGGAGNDRGIYDDAIFVSGPETFVAFNANTDPSPWRQGVASLLPGIHLYKPGRHGVSRDRPGKIVSYPAFRPATRGEALPVKRDGDPDVPSKRPGIAINIHRGGRNTTSSEGCQTLPPEQWPAFQALLMHELKKAGATTFPYILVEGPII